LFAAPRGFSQRTTSFIASRRQGIHQMPLRRLTRMTILTTHNGKYPSSILPLRKLPPPMDNNIEDTGQTRASNSCRALSCLLTSVRQTPRGDYKPSSLCQKTRPTTKPQTRQTVTAAQKPQPVHRDHTRPNKPQEPHTRAEHKEPNIKRMAKPNRMVEPDGIEPTTSCLQSRRSPN
jgi:hypothetical protein